MYVYCHSACHRTVHNSDPWSAHTNVERTQENNDIPLTVVVFKCSLLPSHVTSGIDQNRARTLKENNCYKDILSCKM
jgi:hypothetical protein